MIHVQCHSQGEMGVDTCTVSVRIFCAHGANTVLPRTAHTDSSNTIVGTKITQPKDGTVQSSVVARLIYRAYTPCTVPHAVSVLVKPWLVPSQALYQRWPFFDPSSMHRGTFTLALYRIHKPHPNCHMKMNEQWRKQEKKSRQVQDIKTRTKINIHACKTRNLT